MEQKDHQQANDKIVAPYALARAPSTFRIRILSRLLRAIGQSKIVLVDKQTHWSTGVRKHPYRLYLIDLRLRTTLHRYVSVPIVMTRVHGPRPSARFIKLLNDSSDSARV
jgi:hypothetical protein